MPASGWPRRWLSLDLDKRLGSFFADRDPSVGIDKGRLSGKVAIVTGGAPGQAAAIERGVVGGATATHAFGG